MELARTPCGSREPVVQRPGRMMKRDRYVGIDEAATLFDLVRQNCHGSMPQQPPAAMSLQP